MRPNDSGKKFLIEDCQRVNISDFFRQFKRELKSAYLKSRLKSLGIEVRLATSRTGFGGVRFWFQCPFCKQRVGVLYKHPLNNNIGCRKCLNLEYKSRLYRGMLEEKIIDL